MAACAAPLALSACNSVNFGGGDVGQIYRLTKAAWSSTDRNVTMAQAAASPYASMGIRLGDGPQSMVILATDSGNERLWTSAAHITLATRNGRIVRTAGLEHNLSGYQTVRDTDNENGTRTILWFADFADLGRYSVPIQCRDRNAGPETITILGKTIHTRRVNESCASQSSRLDWTFHNTYWRDPESNLTWRSIQHVHPGTEAIETEILRPPG